MDCGSGGSDFGLLPSQCQVAGREVRTWVDAVALPGTGSTGPQGAVDARVIE